MMHDDKERMMRCKSCGNMVFPKISPAVIVGITDGDRLLMTKYNGRIYKRYALVAGFAEVGETLEETVRREVLEEVGVRVKNIRYYKSQPWPFSDSLLMGFFCDLNGSDNIVLDEDELSEAQWVHRKDINVEADGISLTNDMIVHFKNAE
jgi:NAD+ diphosphatase